VLLSRFELLPHTLGQDELCRQLDEPLTPVLVPP
jgi:hypothetical protein